MCCALTAPLSESSPRAEIESPTFIALGDSIVTLLTSAVVEAVNEMVCVFPTGDFTVSPEGVTEITWPNTRPDFGVMACEFATAPGICGGGGITMLPGAISVCWCRQYFI